MYIQKEQTIGNVKNVEQIITTLRGLKLLQQKKSNVKYDSDIDG